MVEFVHSEEKVIGIDEPIILENNTDASFDVGVGIIFRKSGLYRISVNGKHTSVEIEPERKTEKWIPTNKERPPQYQEIWITSDLGDVELVYGKDGIWLLDESYYTEPEIIAWMPGNAPSPYQPEEESE